jgi:hypothetical protein
MITVARVTAARSAAKKRERRRRVSIRLFFAIITNKCIYSSNLRGTNSKTLLSESHQRRNGIII